jgi:hypothetical protein
MERPMERRSVADLAQSLRVPRRRRTAIARELHDHLEESRRELELAGWSPEDARRESLERLGDLEEIADGFEQVYRPPRRKQIGLACGLASVLVFGVWGIGGQLASATSAHRAVHPPIVHHMTSIKH